MRELPVVARLAANRYELGAPHIEVDAAAVRARGVGPALVRICPAHCYAGDGAGSVTVEVAGCLECGACLIIAGDAIRWRHPDGGEGVAYRQG